jgi:hypothetical protein
MDPAADTRPSSASSVVSGWEDDISHYYADAQVRARIVEFCGAIGGKRPTAAYLTALGPMSRDGRVSDVARSLWDLDNVIFFLQVDYVNGERPEEPFLHPADVLLKLEPAYQASRAVFDALGLDALSIVTGRGYHFVGQVPLDATLVEALASLVDETPAWRRAHLARRPRGITASISARHARAAAGLGLLIEHAAHLIVARAWTSPLPFAVNGAVVGSGVPGDECISIDFSHVGDPLDLVRVRTAFSPYTRHQRRPELFGQRAASLPPLAALPRDRQPLVTLLTDGRGLDVARHMAQTTRTSVPDVAGGVANLFDDYLPSPLAAFHRRFYDERANATGPLPDWRAAALAPRAAASLERPNDRLLKPELLQHVVRGLLSNRWTAAQIAALVHQKFEEPHGWGDRWLRFDARTRADFDVRTFAGLIATGADTPADGHDATLPVSTR